MTTNDTTFDGRRGMHRALFAAVATVLLALSALFASSAHAIGSESVIAASTKPVQQLIDDAMHDRPGGTQISATEVSWEDGAVTLTVYDGLSSRAIGSCAAGSFCAWDGSHLTGSRLSFTSCATHSTAGLSIVRSLANARSSGTVKAKNSGGTVLLTLSANTSTGSAPTGVKSLTCTP